MKSFAINSLLLLLIYLSVVSVNSLGNGKLRGESSTKSKRQVSKQVGESQENENHLSGRLNFAKKDLPFYNHTLVEVDTNTLIEANSSSMARFLQLPQNGWFVPKKIDSPRSRLLFIAGLEGTGHHAFREMFIVCVDAGICEPDHILARASQEFNSSTGEMYGLFSGMGRYEMSHVATLETRMRELANKKGNHLYLYGLEFTAGSGAMSYPNYDGRFKSMDNPDVYTMAMIAESAGLDFRVIVLQRSAESIIRSTMRRGIGGSFADMEPRVLIESANALFTQLLLLDKKFFLCFSFETLSTMTDQQKATLVDFVHPTILKEQLEPMLKQVNYHTPQDDFLDTLDVKYQTMQLANRLALIDGLCRQ